MGKITPPYSVELFFATVVIYYGSNTGRNQSKGRSRFWAGCYDLSPMEAAGILLTIRWTCVCMIGDEIPHALSYLSRLARMAGGKLLYRAIYGSPISGPLGPFLHWAVLLPTRHRVTGDRFIEDRRPFEGNLESLSFRTLPRQLLLAGHDFLMALSVRDCCFSP